MTPLLCKVWAVGVWRASTVWVADPISRNSTSDNLLHAVNFDSQATATLLSKAAVLIRMLVRGAFTGTLEALNIESLTAAQESNYAEAGKPMV